MSVEGLVSFKSAHSAPVTVERLKSSLVAAGQTIFAHIDHAAAARAVGLELPARDLLIYGDPVVGTPLMARMPTLAIDLPMRALVWADDDDGVWLSLNDSTWLAMRHSPTVAEACGLQVISNRQRTLASHVVCAMASGLGR